MMNRIGIKKIIAFYPILLFSITLFCQKEKTFANFYKPLTVNYLYQLIGKHPHLGLKIQKLFKVKKKYNVHEMSGKKVISFSLFWKSRFKQGHQPKISPESIYQTTSTTRTNQSFNSLYVEPLIKQLKVLKKYYPGWIARIYLAHDLEFLVPRLQMDHVEIFVMESNSIAASPGAMWRFLVFDDPHVKMAIIRDADPAADRFDGKFTFSSHIKKWFESEESKGFYRLKNFEYMAHHWSKNKFYSPISGGAFGGKHVNWISMQKGMIGFILHRMIYRGEKRHLSDKAFPGHPYGYGNEFPSYGFDERFLKHVLYFAATRRNQLTLIPTGHLKNKGKHLSANHPIMLDLKYAKFKSTGGF